MRVFQKTCNNFLPLLKLWLKPERMKVIYQIKAFNHTICFIKIPENDSNSVHCLYDTRSHFYNIGSYNRSHKRCFNYIKMFYKCMHAQRWGQYDKSFKNVRDLIWANFTDRSQIFYVSQKRKRRRRENGRDGMAGFESKMFKSHNCEK